MTARAKKSTAPSSTVVPGHQGISKKSTGIKGFDDITRGGLPESRLTSMMGSSGAGKTVFALQMLVNRSVTAGEPGIFVTFEESVARIQQNMASFTWSGDVLGGTGISFVDARIPIDTVLTGAFDLTGLLAGLTALQNETGATNIVFDGIDMLLSGLDDERLERQELSRLDEWIRSSGLTALITSKTYGTGDRDQRRSDFLQYMTDCVVLLDGRFTETTSTRSLRIIKYRGSGFAANPVPAVIGPSGFNVVALRGARLDHPAFVERISSGIARLDALVDGGYIRGSSVLISGAPGTSKTSLGANFVSAACQRGEQAMFISFDESASQITANMRSIGLNLQTYIDSGKLTMESLLSSGRSPEEHFLAICDLLDAHSPTCLVIDPLSSLLKAEYPFAGIICENLLDHIKSRGITVVCSSLLDQVSGDQELSASNVSTIADTWIHVSYVAHEGERNRALTIVKSRGTGHSNQVRELILNQSGVDLVDVYVGEGEVLMGSARLQKEAEDQREKIRQEIAVKRVRMELDRDLADLKMRLQATAGEVAWKEQEAAFLVDAEASRIERDRFNARGRLDLRRADSRENAGKSNPTRDRKKVK